MLGLGEREASPDDLRPWAPPRAEGARLGAIAPLFPRVDKTNDEKETLVPETPPPAPEPDPAPAPAAAPVAAPERIDVSEFAKVELRAAKVTGAE